MKKFKLSMSHLAVAGVLAMALVGCDGDDGVAGADGIVATPISNATAIQATIDQASLKDDQYLSFDFSVTDMNGVPVIGLKAADIASVSFGRIGSEDEVGLTDIEGKARNIWLSYFNKDKSDGHFTGSSYFKGTDCEDCFVDHSNGSYTLTLNKAIDTLGKYQFNGSVTNGIYLSLKTSNAQASLLNNNSFYYWIPNTETVQSTPKLLIEESTCQSCHQPEHAGQLSLHGDKHTTVESCTFCHTDYNSYMKQDKDEEGNTVGEPYFYDGSIKGMAHSIHSHAYYNGIYPQKASNCQTCHLPSVVIENEAEKALSMPDAWKADLDAATCMNCHNSAYAVPSWHWDADNEQMLESKTNCVSCHGQEGEAYTRGAFDSHYTTNASATAKDIKVEFNSVVVADDKSSVTVEFSVKQGSTLIPLTHIDPAPYEHGGYNSAIVFNGIYGDDFSVNYQKVGFDTFKQLENGRIQSVITNGAFKVTEALENNATIVLSSQLHVCFESGAPVACTLNEDDSAVIQDAPYLTSDTYYFNQDGTPVVQTPRVQHATMEACQSCHTSEIYHRYTNDLDGCASCHNGTRDKKGSLSSNLAYITHSKHYLNDFFKKTDCQACHGTDGFSLALLSSNATPVAFGKVDGTGEQTLVSPQTAACVSCHVPPYALDEAAIAHMQQFGGQIALQVIGEGESVKYALGVPASEYPSVVSESCQTCHSDEKILNDHSDRAFPQW